MIDKDYLKKLKEEDYIAYSELTGCPVTGLPTNSSTYFIPFILSILLGLIGVVLYLTFS
jgi:hypothetical protein